jgi:hypothetical protein
VRKKIDNVRKKIDNVRKCDDNCFRKEMRLVDGEQRRIKGIWGQTNNFHGVNELIGNVQNSVVLDAV